MKRTLTLAIAFVLFAMHLLAAPAYAATSADLLNDIVVLPQGEFNKAEADRMIGRLGLIPAPLLQGLKDRGVKIKLVNGKITDEPEFAQYKGVTPRGWENTGLTWDDVPGVSANNVVARIGYSDKNHGHTSHNLEMHETFHAIDRLVLNEVSSSAEFIDVWQQEANNNYSGDGYVSLYSTEYFAETATLYLYSEQTRKQLQEDMPLTYDFLDKLFTNL